MYYKGTGNAKELSSIDEIYRSHKRLCNTDIQALKTISTDRLMTWFASFIA